MIEGIKAAVSIPVMAKARIGHFVEAQILQALGVDFVDESEVLTPGRRGPPHRQVRVRRAVRVRRHEPRRGAAAHRRGRGDDPLQGRGRHRQHRRGRAPPALDHRRHPQAHPGRLGRAVRLGQAAAGPAAARAGGRRDRAGCRCRCSAPAASPPRPTPRWPCSSAPRPCSSARASSRATTRRRGPRRSSRRRRTSRTRRILAKVSRGLGAPMTGIGMDEVDRALRRAGLVSRASSAATRSTVTPEPPGGPVSRSGCSRCRARSRAHAAALAELGVATPRGPHARATSTASTPS